MECSRQRWNAFAYVTADNASDGLFVLDLTRLPHSITRASYPSDFAEAHNVYLSKTDFSTGLALTDDTPVLVIAGSNISDGRFRSYSLNNPASPGSSPHRQRQPASLAATVSTCTMQPR